MVVTYRQTLNDRQEVCTRDTCMGSTGLLSRPTRFDYAASHFVYIFGDFFSKDDVFLFFFANLLQISAINKFQMSIQTGSPGGYF